MVRIRALTTVASSPPPPFLHPLFSSLSPPLPPSSLTSPPLLSLPPQITHKIRQKKFSRSSFLKEPEPYLEPRKNKQLTEQVPTLILQSEDLPREEGGVMPSPDSPYAALGGVEPVNLISFAYQIASGMVGAGELHTQYKR